MQPCLSPHRLEPYSLSQDPEVGVAESLAATVEVVVVVAGSAPELQHLPVGSTRCAFVQCKDLAFQQFWHRSVCLMPA